MWSTVNDLSTIDIEFGGGIQSVSFYDGAIKLTKDGEDVGFTTDRDSNHLIVKPKTLNYSGKYVLTIHGNMVVFTRTLTGIGEFGERDYTFEWDLRGISFENNTVDPVQGEVPFFNNITVTFPDFTEINFVDKDAITATCNGQPKELNRDTWYRDNRLFFQFAEGLMSDPGTYVITIPANSIYGYLDENYSTRLTNPKPLEFSWIITEEDKGFFTYTVSPGEDTPLTEIGDETCSVTFPNLCLVEVGDVQPYFTFNSETVLDASLCVDNTRHNKIKVHVMRELTDPGIYELVIPAKSLYSYPYDEDNRGPQNDKEIRVKWQISQ